MAWDGEHTPTTWTTRARAAGTMTHGDGQATRKVMTDCGQPMAEVRGAVDKQQIRALLDKLEAAVQKAKAAGTYVTLVGD